MFKIFISASSLERLCLKEMHKERKDQSSWFLILCKQKVIYLDRNIWAEWLTNGDDFLAEPLYIFSSSNDVELSTSYTNYNNECRKKESSVFLKEPQGAFLLDVDEDTAKSVQEKYGVICQSTQDLSDCSIDLNEQKFPLFKNKSNYSWERIFSSVKKIPSNALIIVDRYIFSYEDAYQSGCYDGLNNIKEILKNALPEKLDCAFHVLIVFDAEVSDKNFNLLKYAQALEFFKKNELKRPYSILFEFYSLTFKCHNYEHTHNRRIISNYYMGYADHMFKAFAQTGKSFCKQNIRLESAFSYGLHDSLPDSTMTEIQEDLKEFGILHKNALNEFSNNSELACEYDVICGGDEDSNVTNIQNRLILINK